MDARSVAKKRKQASDKIKAGTGGEGAGPDGQAQQFIGGAKKKRHSFFKNRFKAAPVSKGDRSKKEKVKDRDKDRIDGDPDARERSGEEESDEEAEEPDPDQVR